MSSISSFKFEVVPLDTVPREEFRKEARGPKPVILVVDDEPMVADSLSMILSLSGYEPMTAYRGATALQLAKSRTPALMISDIAMPEMNGVELALAMQTLVPECAVLLFSGHATSRDLLGAREAGYDFPLLAKPVPPEELLRHVSRMVHGEKSRARAIPMHTQTTFAKSA